MKCSYEHTVRIPDKDWKCPNCGSGSSAKNEYDETIDGFIVDDSVNYDCPHLHKDDYIKCYVCETEMQGSDFEDQFLGNKKRCICPLCKGSGYIDRVKKRKPI